MSYQINSCVVFFGGGESITGTFGSYSSMSSFLRNFHTIVHSGQHYISNNSVVRGPFHPHPREHLFFVLCFDNSHSDRCEMISSCSFDLHLPDD